MPAEPPAAERLQKVLAHAGVASRRACEEYIAAGRVRVNGQVVRELGTKVVAGVDRIELDGRPVELARPRRYYLLYKPVGYVTTASDPEGRPIVLDLLPTHERLYPVGRLDRESEGLLLCTNDGELTQRLTHPRYEHEREYLVLIRGELTADDVQRLADGMTLPDEARPLAAAALAMGRGWRWRQEELPSGCRWVRMTLKEGHKRQIRRMIEALGREVVRLVRVRVGALRLGQLEPGQGRWLTPAEVEGLRQSAGLP
ncbi:MAG: pseudouridine synthase [Chloroflexota bacterium]